MNLKLKLYNSQTRSKETFVPQDERNITTYSCGPTVYNTPHIGNARPAVVFDVLFRVLRHMYGKEAVSYARNFTDIDDKIMAAAKERGITIQELTEETTKDYLEVTSELNVLDPTHMPKATEYIDQMQEMIQGLVDKGFAYVSEKNEVLFHVPSSKHNSLAKHGEDALRAGERVEVDPSKKDPRDFILWKPSTDDQPGWDSPWGRGRPGWHIECSAMNRALFGDTIDIHTGGQDLRFPHHEAEITQSENFSGKTFANYWMHNGMLTVNGEKMAKSEGNFVTVRDALKRYPGESIRFFLLKTNYRQPLDWTWEGLEEAHNELSSLYRKLRDSEIQVEGDVSVHVLLPLLDDLNTSLAITGLHKEADTEFSALKSSANLLGVLQHDPDEWFKIGVDADAEMIEALVVERDAARDNKDWAKADEIRDQLHAMNIELEDNPDGTIWRKK